MIPIRQRPVGYIVGFAGLLVCVIFYIVAMSTQYWTRYQLFIYSGSLDPSNASLDYPYWEVRYVGHIGLWESCMTLVGIDIAECHKVSITNGYPGWVGGVQAIQCISLIGFIVSVCFATVVNFMQRNPTINNRHLEFSLIFSGITGFIGCVIYATESVTYDDILVHEDYEDSDALELDPNMQIHTVNEMNVLGWSFWLSIVACLLTLVDSMVICAHNRLIYDETKLEQNTPGVSFSTAATTSEQGGGVMFVPPPSSSTTTTHEVSPAATTMSLPQPESAEV